MSSNKNIYNYQTPKSSNEDTSFFNTKGRINRVAFFARLLLVILIYFCSFFLFKFGIHTLFGFRIENFYEIIHLYLLPFVLLLFMLIQGAKRMHDVNKSGWYIFIPFYNLYLILSPGTKGNNDYGIDFNFKQDITYFDEIEQVDNPRVINNKVSSLKKRFGAIKVVFIMFLLLLLISFLIINHTSNNFVEKYKHPLIDSASDQSAIVKNDSIASSSIETNDKLNSFGKSRSYKWFVNNDGDKIEIYSKDLEDWMSLDDAKNACVNLGEGWRLPTKDELEIINKNFIKPGIYLNYSVYCSSSECDGNGGVWCVFNDSIDKITDTQIKCFNSKIGYNFRPVRYIY
jgi:uncharacterized membrane protein YhaH (DUF805 family)